MNGRFVRSILAAALVCLGFAPGPALAGSVNGMAQSYVCDATTNQQLNCLKPLSDGSINVNAAVSASITGFHQTSTGTPISVTTGGVTGSLPTGSEVIATNVGANGAYCALGASATTASQYIGPSGGWFSFAISGDTQLTCITSASTTTVNMLGGAGIPTGVGGAVGGSGGAVTNAGTFAVQLTGATNNINNVAGTVSLPTGAATAALQPTNAAQGSTTSGQTGPLVQGAVTTAAPTYTTAQTNPLSLDTSGDVRVLDKNSAALLAAAQGSIPAGAALIGKVGVDQTTPGTTNAVSLAQVGSTTISTGTGAQGAGTPRVTVATDTATIAGSAPSTVLLAQPTAGTTGGTTPFTLTAANSTNATNIKASAGLVDHVSVYNISATPAWVSFYDTASTPTCGTAIKYQVLAPANSTSGAGAVEDYAIGVGHASGIGICFTTGIAGTGSVAASSYVVNVFYK